MNIRLAAAVALGALTLVGCFVSTRPHLLGSSDGITCAVCRMRISEVRFAAQLVPPGEEALFFDDISCLATYLKADRATPEGTGVYVADYGTGEWVEVHAAVYARDAVIETPMSSHLLAFRDLAGATAGATKARKMVSTVEAIGERWVMSTIQ